MSVQRIQGPNGREFIIEIKLRQPDDEPRSQTWTSNNHRVHEVIDEREPSHWDDIHDNPWQRQSRMEPQEAPSPHRMEPAESVPYAVPYSLPYSSVDGSLRRSGSYYSAEKDFRVRANTRASGIGRSESRASRMNRRFSRASEVFYDATESQGWGESRMHQNTGFRRMDDVEGSPDRTLRGSKTPAGNEPAPAAEAPPTKYGLRIWLIIGALCVTNLLVALEGTVTSTALPTIVEALGGGEEFVWASTGYFLTSTVFQPLYGQLANMFGRRWLIIFAVSMFVLGSGISGGAPSMIALIFGRVIQGIGGGGINMLVNLIVCDLVPLRDRGKFMAVIFGAISVGTSLGPFLGGIIVQNTTWRWVFYLNIPVGCASLIFLFFFLNVGGSRKGSIKENLKKIDYGGNFIFILAVSMILVALAYGGTTWAWDSYQVIISLVFGVFGLVVFCFWEESNYCVEPTVPLRLFTNRTSAAAYAITFIHSMLTLLVIYFLPVYFQGVLLSSPTRSGVQMLPTVIVLVPFSAISGALLSKFGRYKPFHFAGFAILTAGLGSFVTLKSTSSEGVWIIVQFIVAVGSGFSLSTLLPAAQAPFSDKDTAAATATWAFVRQFGVVWGVSVPSAIFNARFDALLPRIDDAVARATLGGGGAYEHATKEYVGSFVGPVKGQIISVYTDSLKLVWIFAAAMAGLGFLLVFVEREIALRSSLDSEYGLKDEKKAPLVEKK